MSKEEQMQGMVSNMLGDLQKTIYGFLMNTDEFEPADRYNITVNAIMNSLVNFVRDTINQERVNEEILRVINDYKSHFEGLVKNDKNNS